VGNDLAEPVRTPPARDAARSRSFDLKGMRYDVVVPIPLRRVFASTVGRGYALWRTTRFSLTERQRLFGLTVAIGGVCGLVAVAFHHAISALEQLTIDRAFDAEDWIAWVIAIPTLGALAAGILLRFVPGARGSGIPQVKLAYVRSFRIRFRDALGKFGIGTLQVGTGSSLGLEGPTVFICSGVATGIGKLAGVSLQNLKLLLPVGAAAGIAAAFNAPIAAVTFTIEEIIGNLEQTLLTGVIVAAALAAVVARSLNGDNPVFSIPQGYGLDHPSSLVTYVALGVAAAIVSVMFTDSLLWLRAKYAAMSRLPGWARPATGGLVAAGLAVTAVCVLGVRGGITGGGYEGLVAALGGTFPVKTLLILGALKLLATVFSYSSGGAGGIFAPTLFIGGMLGGAFGALDVELFGHQHAELGSFALVGMGAVFAGTVRAPITSVLIIMEMTGGYGLTLPLMISNMIAFGIARALRPTQIYEAFLVQDGVQLHSPRATETLDGVMVSRIELDRDARTLSARDPASLVVHQMSAAGRQEIFPVIDAERRLVGIIALDDIASLAAESDQLEGLVCAADLMRPPVFVRAHDQVQHALAQMAELDARQLPVLDLEDRVAGLIDEADIAHELLRIHAARKQA
jgi:CIC family chloride channel protein